MSLATLMIFLTLQHHVSGLPASEGGTSSSSSLLHLDSHFDRTITVRDRYGGNYKLSIDTNSVYTSARVANYQKAQSSEETTVTVAEMSNDIDNHRTMDEARDIAGDSLEKAYSEALSAYHSRNSQWCFENEDGCPPCSRHICPVSTSDTSETREESISSSANKGALTATLIKGTGTVCAASISLTSTLSSDPDTKLVTGTIAASVSTVILFLLSAMIDWIKNSGRFEKTNAKIFKMWGEWTRSALEEVDASSEHSCLPTVTNLHNIKLVSQTTDDTNTFGVATSVDRQASVWCPV